jgi:intracellular septation protein
MGAFGYTLRYFANDLAPMILFLVVFLASGNIYLATGLGIVFGLAQLGWSLARSRPVGMLQWASLGLVVVFGTATLVTRDPRFIMLKPTAISLILGAVMLKPGWMERYTPEATRAVVRPLLNRFGYIWAGLMFFSAALNLALVAAVDPATWARVNLVYPPASLIGLFAVQNLYMRRRAARAGHVIPG